MSGYKRVNYYELCRLCATNQQKEKTHIFQEEGRKIQLLNKIQSCLSLTVYEHDFLPKVVCSKCLKSLETYYTFKQECISSETMLSSYFKNFRYTEDFKKSGKVYIKDTSNRNINEEEVTDVTTTNQVNAQPVQVAVSSQSQQNAPLLQNYVAIAGALNETSKSTNNQNQAQIEQVQSYYAVQLPQTAIVTNQPPVDQKSNLKSSELPNKISQHPQVAYNLNTVNLAPTNVKSQQKSQETINNVVVNANGEVINIGQLVDLESIINQASLTRLTKNNNNFKQKRVKEPKITDESIIKIDLTESEHRNTFDTNSDKLPHIKSTQNHQKFSYNTSKVEEKVQVNVNPTVIFNTVQDYQVPISNFVPFHQNSGNISYSTTSGNAVNIAPPTICTSSTNEPSTVNLNALNGDLVSGAYRNPSQFATQTVKTTVRDGLKSDNVSNSFKSSPNTDKLHVCDICHKSFKRREHLYQHIKLHTGFRPYTCENCHKSFMRKEHLLRHMTSHSGQKNYTCNICEKSFSRNDNLLKHKKTHEKQNSFTCEVCQKQFVMKHYYLAHKVTHEVVERCIGQTLGILKA